MDNIQKISNQPLRSIALVMSLASDESPLNKVLSEKFPNQHHIFAVPSNELAVGEDFTNITCIKGYPILPSELWTALMATAGAATGAKVGAVAPTDALGHSVQWLDASDTQSAPFGLTDAVSPASVNMLVAEDNAVDREVM